MRLKIKLVVLIVLVFAVNMSFIGKTYSAGGIVTDGSIGSPVHIISAPNSTTANIVINQSDGVTEGHNLFHSFSKFNIELGQTVAFKENTTNSLENVISRVTGGSRSEIYGTLQSTQGGHANFYLINPFGVVFGQNAQIDVPAGFHVSTADALNFRDGGKFKASLEFGSKLSAASPSDFGFIGTSSVNNGLIKINGSNLAVTKFQKFDLTSGRIQIENSATITAPSGNIRMASIQGQSVVKLDTNLPLPNEQPTKTNSGDITIRGKIDGSGNGGAKISLWGNNISIVDSNIFADNSGASHASENKGIEINSSYLKVDNSNVTFDVLGSGNGGNIDVRSNRSIDFLNAGVIRSTTEKGGNAGTLTLKTGILTINGKDNEIDPAGVVSRSIADKSGKSANIVISADSINVLDGGVIRTSTEGDGQGGDIQLKANNIDIDGNANKAGALIQSVTFGSGRAGNLTIYANGDLNIKNGGFIDVETRNNSTGGDITICADRITIDNLGFVGEGEFDSSGIATVTHGSGSAGKISIMARELNVTNDKSIITSSTDNKGKAGNISIDTDIIKIDGKLSPLSLNDRQLPSILAVSSLGSSGDSGNIKINSKIMEFLNGANIATSTESNGKAGSISLDADKITIGKDVFVSSRSLGLNSSGQTGSIDLIAKELLSISSGTVTIENQASVSDSKIAGNIKPGTIKITAHDIQLANGLITTKSDRNVAAGAIDLKFSGTLSMDSSLVSTNANEGNGGAINIQDGQLIYLQDSGITTNVDGKFGNGGPININVENLVMDTAAIQGNTAALSGAGGNINLNMKALITSGNMLTVGGSDQIPWKPGIFGFNVIQAAAPNGLNGQIQSSAPQLNLSGDLSNLGAPQYDTGFLSQEYCSLGSGSSLTRSGKGGLLPKGSEWSVY